MTAQDVIHAVSTKPLFVVIACVLPPLIALVAGLVHGKENGRLSPWKYLYAVLVYLVCFPGILAALLTAYALFFTRENLLAVNMTVYFLPIISMVVTLILIRKNVSFDDVPGFDRISGLMTLIGVTFALVLAISRTSIWLVFGGSIFMLIGLVAGLFALMKWGTYMLFRGKNEPRVEPPKFPGNIA